LEKVRLKRKEIGKENNQFIVMKNLIEIRNYDNDLVNK
jgi:hypothetical protein